jgi:hypothetical protein
LQDTETGDEANGNPSHLSAMVAPFVARARGLLGVAGDQDDDKASGDGTTAVADFVEMDAEGVMGRKPGPVVPYKSVAI